MRFTTRAIARPCIVLAAAVALATCAESSTGPSSGDGLPAHFALAPKFSTAAVHATAVLEQAGVIVAKVRVVITRPGTDDELFNEEFVVEPGQSSVLLEADLLLRAAQEVLTVTIDFLDASGVVMFSATQNITVSQGTNESEEFDAEIQFVGPGNSATQLSLAPSDTVISTLTPLQLTATARDAAGAVISNPVVAFTSADPALATISVTGQVTPLGPRGSVQVTGTIPNGVTGSATISLIPPAARLVVIGGDAQAGAAGSALEQPFTVEVQAADGLPVPGETVTFSAVTEGGSIATATATSDAQGRASTAITLGTVARPYEFRAVSGSLAAVTITGTASAGPAAQVLLVSGNEQSGTVGSMLPAPLSVKVKDAHGNAVAGATVLWEVVAGAGSAASATTASSVDGFAINNYTLGVTPGSESVEARIDGVADAAVAFTMTAVRGTAEKITIVSGNGQSADAGTALALPLVVSLADAFDNAGPGETVTWTVTSGNATVTAATTVTGDDAKASNTVTLGSPASLPAAAVIVATAPGGATVSFSATITAPPPVPSKLLLVTTPASVAVGSAFTPGLSVQLADESGAAVAQPGVTVAVALFEIALNRIPGDSTARAATLLLDRALTGATTATTDASGVATFPDLGVVGPVGAVQLEVSATGFTGVTTGSIDVLAGPVAALALRPEGFTEPVTLVLGSTIDFNVWLETTDASGNVVANVPVLYTVRVGTGAGPIVVELADTTGTDGRIPASSIPVPDVTGIFHVSISVPGAAITPVVLTLDVQPPPVAMLVPVPLSFVPTADTVLSEKTLSVLLKDPAGVPVAGASIVWSVPEPEPIVESRAPMLSRGLRGNLMPDPRPSASSSPYGYAAGFVSGSTVEFSLTTTTDATGHATVQLHRGILAGTVPVTITAPDYSLTAELPVDVAAGQPMFLHVAQDPSLAVQAGIPFAQQPIIVLRDIWDNPSPYAGVPIRASADRWFGGAFVNRSSLNVSPAPGAASTSSECSECDYDDLSGTTTVTTDAAGHAKFTDLALTSETGTFMLRFENVERDLYAAFPDCGDCGSEQLITLSAGDPARWNVTVGDEFPAPQATITVDAVIVDGWDNPILDGVPRSVQWSDASGLGGVFTPATSQSDGTAYVSATFTASATTATTHVITATSTEGGTVIGTAVVTTVATLGAVTIQIEEGDDQVAAPGVPLAPLKVRVLDESGSPVANVPVRWVAESYYYSDYNYPFTTTTDANGFTQYAPTLPLAGYDDDRVGFMVRAEVLGTPTLTAARFRAATLLPGYTHVWFGTKGDGTAYMSSESWNTASAWHSTVVPAAGSNVLIPNWNPYWAGLPYLENDVTVNDFHGYGLTGQYLDIAEHTLTVSGNMRATEIYGPGTVLLTGNGKLATVSLWSGVIEVAPQADITATDDGLSGLNANIYGRLALADTDLNLTGAVRVEGASAKLVMHDFDADVWANDIVVDGASSQDNLSEGYITVINFEQKSTYSGASFAPGAELHVYLNNYAGASAVSFQSPGNDPTTTSFFSSLATSSGTTTQATPVVVTKSAFLDGIWNSSSLTAAEVGLWGTLNLGGTNHIDLLDLSSTAALTASLGGTLTVGICENPYGVVVDPLITTACGVIAGSLAPLTTIGTMEQATRPAVRERPPVKPPVRRPLARLQ